MKTRLHFTGVLFALGMLLAGPAANAQLISTNTSSFYTMTSFENYQPIANLVVGDTNLAVSSFSVFGRATGNANLSWVLFDMTSGPLADDYNVAASWQSGVQSVGASASAGWYSSPTIPVAFSTLLANHMYSMGVVAGGNFAWGQSIDSPTNLNDGRDVVVGNLTIPFQVASTYVVDATSLTAGRDIYSDTAGVQTSLAVFGAVSAPPVPEPAEWTMLLAGLLVVGVVANRQRRHHV